MPTGLGVAETVIPPRSPHVRSLLMERWNPITEHGSDHPSIWDIIMLRTLLLGALVLMASTSFCQTTLGDPGNPDSSLEDLAPPVAVVPGDITIHQGEEVRFNGSQSTDNVGIVNWTWFFIIGEKDYTLYGEVVSFSFEYAESCSVQLTVRDGAGLQNSTVFNVLVIITEKQERQPVNPLIWWVAFLIFIAFLVLALSRIRQADPVRAVGEDPYHLHP